MKHRIEANKRFLTNLYRKGPFERHGFVCKPPMIPCYEGPDNDFTTSSRPVREWLPMILENYQRQLRLFEQVHCDTVPSCDLTTGTHLYAAAFGCPVNRDPTTLPCALPLVRTAEEADAIAEPDIWSSPTLYRVFELAAAVRDELGPDVPLGPPDKQTGFDTACLVWEKTGIYSAMLTDGEKDSVKRLTAKCTRLLVAFLKALHKEFPTLSSKGCPGVWAPPEMGPGYSNDECGAFGTDLFEEFCLPELIELSETFGGLGMHCCAAADHQFPLFRRIPNFYAFNRVLPPGSVRGYAPMLEHLGGADGPVHVLAWISDETMETLIRTAPAGTRFIFAKLGVDAAQGAAWLERMRAIKP